MAPLLELADDLLCEILLRLPPDDPACLLRASLDCRRWRRILADPAFRRRHRELHPRHSSSASFASLGPRRLGPLTNEQRRLPRPSPPPTVITHFNAAVLCSAAAGGCDHRGCHGGPFRVVFLVTSHGIHVTSARVYSSETGDWSELSIEHPYACIRHKPFPSAHVGDTLYFRDDWENVFEFQLGTQHLSLSVILRPPKSNCIGIVFSLMSEENGGLGSLGFASTEEEPCLRLCLWSRETAHDGVARWVWEQGHRPGEASA
ncbi:hypothetical protein C2845_PM05G11320 [Panicum miliaceum]|uniref:F-box domain-containing protein n=1 Tax=Panicum miliaceum TaxID=4540 RepID=A0A3L6T2P2_PANMI|nr:hypothetical protein C2845_PM05G11320 [Panicum miliaceum]